MPYLTPRRDRMRLALARATGAVVERDRIGFAQDAHDARISSLGRMIADRDERLAWVEKRNAEQTELINWFNATCAKLEDRADRNWNAWRSARRRAAAYLPYRDVPRRTITGHNPYADENGRLRDENKRLGEIVAELTAANHAKDVPITWPAEDVTA